MHRDPASLVILLSFMTVALAVGTTVGRNRSIVLAAALSASVTAGALAVGYHDCYNSFRDTVYRNVHNGVMAGVIDEGRHGRYRGVVEGWQGLSREELSREFIRFRLGPERSGGFVDYMALVSRDDFTRTRGVMPLDRDVTAGGRSLWRALAGQFTLTFALAVLGIMPPTLLARLRGVERVDNGYTLPGINMADIWTAMPAVWPARTEGKPGRSGRR
jgi:hypothetical protein